MKAVNTLNIELSQIEARLEALTTQNSGHQDIINSNLNLIAEYQAQIDDLKAALEKLQ